MNALNMKMKLLIGHSKYPLNVKVHY